MSDAAGLDALELALARRHARGRALRDALWLGPHGAAYRALCAAWFIASLARLTLLDQRHGTAWWISAAAHAAAAAGLWRFGGRIFWAASFAALAVPYLFLRDWMTQTWVQLLIAAVGACTAHRTGDGRAVRLTAVAICALTYLAAAFHKLNTGFLDPATSCATYGWDKLDALFTRLDLAVSPAARAWIPPSVLATELALAVGIPLSPRRAVPLAVVFHIPLTLVLAPAFVFVMGVGFAAALSDHTWERLARVPRGAPALVAIALTASVAAVSEPLGVVLWLKLAALSFCAALAARAGASVDVPERWPPRACAFAAVASVAFVANSATPYLGTQTQHTGAMLSNLRIDAGCWNHLLIPESARRVDPYVRIDDARLGPQGLHTDREATLEGTLWPPSSLPVLRANWCRPSTRPLAIRGTYRGDPFAVDDLCAPDAAFPAPIGVLGGAPLAPGVLTLQKNLTRACPSACVH